MHLAGYTFGYNLTAPFNLVHMQDKEKYIFKSHLQTIFNSTTSAFQALNIDCIYSSSSIYGK